MSAPPQQREIVYCHQCENEWYRDENGLQCPECQSEFIEIVEGGTNDPRQQRQEAEAAAEAQQQHPLHDHDPWNAPDPDEEDIEHLRWRREPWDGGGPQRYRATFNRSVDLGGGGGGAGGVGGAAAGGGLMGMIGNMVNGLLQQQREQQQGHEDAARNPASSPPGSPDRGNNDNDGPQQTRPGTYTRHITGPGYSFTMTASSGSGPRGGSALLSPRNANSPQPFNAQPQDMDDLMQQMFSNIGAFPPLPHHQGHQHHNHAHAQPNPLLHLLNSLTIPASGGIHGDAVYSQEALDRIVTQLMDQHSSGNAPGPASPSAIKSLPSRPLPAADAGDCSICMDAVPAGEHVTVLPCDHWFHAECIRAWLAEHDTCPHCRMGIMAREGGGLRGAGEEARNGVRDGRGVAGGSAPGSSAGGSAGVFGRMRDAFGGGGGGGAA